MNGTSQNNNTYKHKNMNYLWYLKYYRTCSQKHETNHVRRDEDTCFYVYKETSLGVG